MCAAAQPLEVATLKFVSADLSVRSGHVGVVRGSSVHDAVRTLLLGEQLRRTAGASVPKLSVTDDIARNVPLEFGPGTFVAILTDLDVQRKVDGRRFAVSYLVTTPFSVVASDVESGQLAVDLGPLQLVKLHAISHSGVGVPHCMFEILDQGGSFASRSNDAGEAWVLLGPGRYLVIAGPTVDAQSELHVGDHPTVDEVTLELRCS